MGTRIKSVYVKLDLRTYVVGTCLQSTIFDVFTLPSSSEVWKWGPEMDLSCLWVATAVEKHLPLDTECTEVGKYLSLLATKNKCFDTLVNDNNHLIITDFTMIIPIRDVRTAASHCTSVLLAQGPCWHCGPLCLNSWSQVILHYVMKTILQKRCFFMENIYCFIAFIFTVNSPLYPLQTCILYQKYCRNA